MTGEAELYERMVRDAMEQLRFSRKKAETLAQKMIRRLRKNPNALATPKKLVKARKVTPGPAQAPKTPGKAKKLKNRKAPARALTRAEIAKLPPAVPPRPPPRNAKERMERALGPDEGERRRRGGSPVVQGGSPGLGRRR